MVVVQPTAGLRPLGLVVPCRTCHGLNEVMLWPGEAVPEPETRSAIAEDWERRWKRGLTAADEKELLESIRECRTCKVLTECDDGVA